jgi:carbamoyltransferase
MFILGVNPSHDATAVLVNEKGEVLAAIGEERITRKKYHETFPYDSIKWILNYTGIKPDEISMVTYNWENLGGFTWIKSNFGKNRENIDWANKVPFRISSSIFFDKIFKRKSKLNDLELVKKALTTLGIKTDNIKSYDHQLCHIASAYYSSDFNDCLVFSLDGYGDNKSGAVYAGSKGKLKFIENIGAKKSIGGFYSNMTSVVGFKRNRHEGKITGLAAYGDSKKFIDKFRRFISLETNKNPEFDQVSCFFCRLIDVLRYALTGNYQSKMIKEAVKIRNKYNISNEDLSAVAQDLLESTVVGFIKKKILKYKINNVALAGGVFANVKLNQKILKDSGSSKIFIHPNMGDGGGAFGSAMLGLSEILDTAQQENFHIGKFKNVFFGPDYSNEIIEKSLKKYDLLGKAKKHKNIEVEIAQKLANGLIVGRFKGRMEYGPRSLGNRSILASATNASINQEINTRLNRNEFMPFAPIVMKEHCSRIFKDFKSSINSSKFMTITLDVNEEWIDKIPAVVHIDNTARPQWVSLDYNSSCHKVIEEYNKITGIPVLVNTSFNRHEEPIVMTPDDAIKAYLAGAVDVLAIEDWIVGEE